MGFDIMGVKAKNKKGEYFRNNVWWWRRLWLYVCFECSDILTPEDIEAGGWNDGHTITQDKAEAIAKRLKEARTTRRTAQFAKDVTQIIKQAKEHNKYLNSSDKTYNWDERYPFSAKNVYDFEVFCRNSGGFKIC